MTVSRVENLSIDDMIVEIKAIMMLNHKILNKLKKKIDGCCVIGERHLWELVKKHQGNGELALNEWKALGGQWSPIARRAEGISLTAEVLKERYKKWQRETTEGEKIFERLSAQRSKELGNDNKIAYVKVAKPDVYRKPE